MKEKRVLNEQGRIFYKGMLLIAIVTYLMYSFAILKLGFNLGFFNGAPNTVATIFLGVYGIGIIWFTINVIKKLKVK